METLNLNVNLENLTTEEREALMKLVEKSQEKKSKVWKPEPNDFCYFINGFGEIIFIAWHNEKDYSALELNNVFRTKEEAEEELTRRKMLTKWKMLSVEAGEEENEWDGANLHRYPFFNVVTRNIVCNSNASHRLGNIYFPTEKSLLAAIKELGEENVKKYILGVRD